MNSGHTPYGLRIIQSCLACPVQHDSLFCRLGPEALQELNALRQTSVYPKGTLLFVEGQPCRGLFVLCSGKAKLTASSRQGRSVIVRVANPGEVLGLSAVVSNSAYEVSAETLGPAEANFLPRDRFIRFLQNHAEVSLQVAHCLSTELQRAYHQVSRIALAPSARAKLASLLLDWAGQEGPTTDKDVSLQLHMTHEEVGELIGSSRETVTRLLNDFRRRGLIETNRTTVTVLDPARLKAISH
jgi:CRP/FNR family transcriptional regulator